MQLPIVAPAPLVTAHADVFRDLFENRCQFQHFQHYLTGLMVLPNKSLTNIARCMLESADKTNLSRFFSEAPGSKTASMTAASVSAPADQGGPQSEGRLRADP